MTLSEDYDFVSKEEINQAVEEAKKLKTQPIRGYAFQLRARQLLRQHFDVLFMRALYRRVTKLLQKDIDYSLLDDSNVVGVMFGLKRVGKSEILKGIAKYIQTREIELGLYSDPKILLSFSNDETTFLIKHKAKSGDIIWQDEIIDQSGEDSLTQRRQIFNLQENLAKKHIHFLFASNKRKGFEEISNFVLLPIQKDKITVMNTAMVFYKSELDGRLVPLGRVTIQLTNDPELNREYKKRKREYVDNLAESGGFSMVKVDPIKAERDQVTVEELMSQELAEIPLKNWKKSWIHTFIRDANIIGSNAYLDYLKDKIEISIVKRKLLYEETTYESQAEEEDLATKQPSDFNDFLKESIERALVQKGVFPSKEKAQRYSHYFFDLDCRTWEDVSQILGEKELSDTLRKYVSNRKRAANPIVSKTFETAIANFLNKKIIEESSSPEIPSSKLKFLVGSGKEKCDIFLGKCPGEHFLSINAKLNLGDRSSYQHPISPEFAHCESNAFVFEWTRRKGLFIARVDRKKFQKGSGEEYTLPDFISYVKVLKNEKK